MARNRHLLTYPVDIQPTSWANRRSFDPKSVGSPRHVEFELDVLDCTIRIWLRTHSNQAIAQATLQRANLLPLQSIGWVSSRLRLRNDVASQALTPVVIVALGTGYIELPLATFEKFTTRIKKGLQAFVDCNLINFHATDERQTQ